MMTRRGFLGPVLSTIAMTACAPLSTGLGLERVPADWTEARFTYGADPRQSLYIRRPKDPSQAVAAILILSSAAPTKADETLAAQIADQGMVAIVVGRRPSPVAAFPAYVGDNAKALDWCIQRAEALGLAPDRIGILGLHSGALHARMLVSDGRYLAAVGQAGRVKSVAVAGLETRPDATFTHPDGYENPALNIQVWRGEEFEIIEAIRHLKQNLNPGQHG